jgi:hypothetical protein
MHNRLVSNCQRNQRPFIVAFRAGFFVLLFSFLLRPTVSSAQGAILISDWSILLGGITNFTALLEPVQPTPIPWAGSASLHLGAGRRASDSAITNWLTVVVTVTTPPFLPNLTIPQMTGKIERVDGAPVEVFGSSLNLSAARRDPPGFPWDPPGVPGSNHVAIFLVPQFIGQFQLDTETIAALIRGELFVRITAASPDGVSIGYSLRGQILPLDHDGDGIIDYFDHCPDSVPGAIVDAAGCSIEQICPCAAPWRNHGAYVSCIADVASDFEAGGLINRQQRNQIVRGAAISACGGR